MNNEDVEPGSSSPQGRCVNAAESRGFRRRCYCWSMDVTLIQRRILRLLFVTQRRHRDRRVGRRAAGRGHRRHRRVRVRPERHTGMGIAALIPFSAVTGIFTGAMLDVIWKRVAPRSQAQYAIPAASGLLAGEALVAVVIPLLVTLGLMKL